MTIVLSEYNNDWPQMFEHEKSHLLRLIGNFNCGSIEHVGSTSVTGMLAKPVIDIMFGVSSLEASRQAITILEQSAYCHYPYKPDLMHWFCKPSPEVRTHHLHLVPFNSKLWKERIDFRDLLREGGDIFTQYKALKVRLAREVGFDRELYTQSKGPFIQRALDSIDS